MTGLRTFGSSFQWDIILKSACLLLVFSAGSLFGEETERKERDKKQVKEVGTIWLKEIHKKKSGDKPDAKAPALKKADQVKLNNPGKEPVNKPATGKAPFGSEKKTPGKPALPGTSRVNTNNRLFKEGESTSFLSVFLRFSGVMLVMLGGFYVIIRFMKKRSGTLGTGNDLVQVVASVPLVQGKFIQIVDLAGKLMVLGVSENGVNMLSEIQDARTADRIRIWQSERAANPVMPTGLLEVLTKTFKSADYSFWGKSSGGGGGEQRDVFRSNRFRDLLEKSGGNPDAAYQQAAQAAPVYQQPAPEAEIQETPPPAAPLKKKKKTTTRKKKVIVAEQPPLQEEPLPFVTPEPALPSERTEADLEKMLESQRRKLASLKGRAD